MRNAALNFEAASWIPGVSKKRICACGRVLIPKSRFHVVWGFDETMAIFSPTRQLMSVDFPTLGLPTMGTTPE